MKYRIIRKDNYFYPQFKYKYWPFWIHFKNKVDRTIKVCHKDLTLAANWLHKYKNFYFGK